MAVLPQTCMLNLREKKKRERGDCMAWHYVLPLFSQEREEVAPMIVTCIAYISFPQPYYYCLQQQECEVLFTGGSSHSCCHSHLELLDKWDIRRKIIKLDDATKEVLVLNTFDTNGLTHNQLMINLRMAKNVNKRNQDHFWIPRTTLWVCLVHVHAMKH